MNLLRSMRSIAEQNNLYAQGRTQAQLNAVGLTGVTAQPNLPWATNARGGLSYHNYGLAIDVYRVLGDGSIQWNYNRSLIEWAANRAGINWLNNFDPPHFQKTFGFTTDQLRRLNTDENGWPILNNN